MRFPTDRKTWVRIGCWIVFLTLAPFAIELVILADIVGVEMAVLFLVVYYRALAVGARGAVANFRVMVRAAIPTSRDDPPLVPRAYWLSTVASSAIVWTGGSLMLALYMWLPSISLLARYH